MKVSFWGVRGSIPTPERKTSRYGGNTSCVSVELGDSLVILDAGTGIRDLSSTLVRRGGPVRAHLLFTHTHWDHIQGFPFFAPAYDPRGELDIYGSAWRRGSVEKVLRLQSQRDVFPVPISDLQARVRFHVLERETLELGGIRSEFALVNHPGCCVAFRLSAGGRTVIYATDHEPLGRFRHKLKEGISVALRADSEEKLFEFLGDADLLICDAQYTSREYENRVSWGHNPVDYAVHLAAVSRTKHLVIFHHDPEHSDSFMDSMLTEARRLPEAKSIGLITVAREGTSIRL